MKSKDYRRMFWGITALLVGAALIIQLARRLSVASLLWMLTSHGMILPILVAATLLVFLVRRAGRTCSATAMTSAMGLFGAVIASTVFVMMAAARIGQDLGRQSTSVLLGSESGTILAMGFVWITIGAFIPCWSLAVLALWARELLFPVAPKQRVSKGMKVLATLVLGVLLIDQIVSRLLGPYLVQ